MVCILLLATIYDLKYNIIPNYISLLTILIGLYNGKIYISGLLVAIFILIITLKFENYKGGGDIKLIGAIGLLKGFEFTYGLFLFSEILELVFRLILKILKKPSDKGIAYAPIMLISSILLLAIERTVL